MLDILENVCLAYLLVLLFLYLSGLLQQRLTWLRWLYLPDCVVAGTIALLLSPQALGMIVPPESLLADGLFPERVRQIWAATPSVTINLVFATLFLGKSLPSLQEIWQKAAPQMAFGQSLAWGQYVVGLSLVLLLLGPLFGVNPLVGALIEVSFEGGHGTAAGMAGLFTELGFPEGGDLSMGLATVGNVSGVAVGTMLIAWGRRVNWVSTPQAVVKDQLNATQLGTTATAKLPSPGQIVRHLLPKGLLNLGFVGLAVASGWLLLLSLTALEELTLGKSGLNLFAHVPLFPMALVGSIGVQLVLERLQLEDLVDIALIELIEKIAIDITIFTALASISLQVLGSNWVTFVVLSLAGILWNVFAFLILAPRMFPSYWFERGIGDMGQSMGITATGLLLLRMVDPENRSSALESFAYKQLMFEPIMGGGIFTAAAPLLIAQFGPLTMLLVTGAILAFWLFFGLVVLKLLAGNSQEQISDRTN